MFWNCLHSNKEGGNYIIKFFLVEPHKMLKKGKG